MRYVSRRGGVEAKSFTEILLEGLAADGGLYVPEQYPQISGDELQEMRGMSYPELAFNILSRYMDDIPAEDLRRIVDETYTKENFGSGDIVPTKKLEDGLYILGLSEGPTLAFKDIALQLLGRLFEYALARNGETLNILGATSGDTGSAAECAMRGRRGIKVFMLSPEGRMSEFQQLGAHRGAGRVLFLGLLPCYDIKRGKSLFRSADGELREHSRRIRRKTHGSFYTDAHSRHQ